MIILPIQWMIIPNPIPIEEMRLSLKFDESDLFRIKKKSGPGDISAIKWRKETEMKSVKSNKGNFY